MAKPKLHWFAIRLAVPWVRANHVEQHKDQRDCDPTDHEFRRRPYHRTPKKRGRAGVPGIF